MKWNFSRLALPFPWCLAISDLLAYSLIENLTTTHSGGFNFQIKFVLLILLPHILTHLPPTSPPCPPILHGSFCLNVMEVFPGLFVFPLSWCSQFLSLFLHLLLPTHSHVDVISRDLAVKENMEVLSSECCYPRDRPLSRCIRLISSFHFSLSQNKLGCAAFSLSAAPSEHI